MTNAYAKKKQPEAVRRAILDAVERIAITQGPSAITIQAVAAAAGITKGGVTHHYENKQILIAAMLADLLLRMDQEIDRHLDGQNGHGCFTRAYIEVLLIGTPFGANSPFDALSLMSIAEPSLAGPWTSWLDGRLARHGDTDGDPHLEIIRLAADGAWLSYIGKAPDKKLEDLGARLIEMTRLG